MKTRIRRAALAVALTLAWAPAPGRSETPAELGERLFDANCAQCHGERISNPNNLFDLKELRQDERARFDTSVRQGKGQMPAWDGTFTDAEFHALWAYIRAVSD